MFKAWSLVGLLLPISNSTLPPCCEQEVECLLPTAREERNLFMELNCESRRLYNSLDCLAKRRALALAEVYPNKNVAVQEAAKEMGHRLKIESAPPYQEIDELGGQQYFDKYGY